MSLRAEIARLAARWFIKRHARHASAAQSRARLDASARLVPRPPKGTSTVPVDAGGVPAVRISVPASRADRHILYLHGGGYVGGSPRLYRHVTWRLARAAQAIVTAIDYRLAPEHPFPAAVDDAFAAYRSMLAEGIAPQKLAVMGDSAGGGLTLALLLKLRDAGVPLPAAAVGISPWTDLALTGASIDQNAEADPMISVEEATAFTRHYLSGADPRHPYASPLYGDPTGLPPCLIQVGSDEVLRDDATRMAARLRAAGCQVELQVWPRMPHVWHAFVPFVPEARRGIAHIGAFLRGVMR